MQCDSKIRDTISKVSISGCSGDACLATYMVAMSECADSVRHKPCPICSKPAVETFRPFCSRRCADVDLNRWLSGVYAVPVREDEDEDGLSSTKAEDAS
jgi:endogenous inhibitor of DNA gyrase (YacG/DUF329 family)